MALARPPPGADGPEEDVDPAVAAADGLEAGAAQGQGGEVRRVDGGVAVLVVDDDPGVGAGRAHEGNSREQREQGGSDEPGQDTHAPSPWLTAAPDRTGTTTSEPSTVVTDTGCS